MVICERNVIGVYFSPVNVRNDFDLLYERVDVIARWPGHGTATVEWQALSRPDKPARQPASLTA